MLTLNDEQARKAVTELRQLFGTVIMEAPEYFPSVEDGLAILARASSPAVGWVACSCAPEYSHNCPDCDGQGRVRVCTPAAASLEEKWLEFRRTYPDGELVTKSGTKKLCFMFAEFLRAK